MRLWYIGLAMILASLAACQRSPLEKALRGDLSLAESNEVITEYCQSCHIHRAFDPSPHIPRMQPFYNGPPYSVTTACRTCHMVYKDTWRVKHRKTLWPAEATPGAKRQNPSATQPSKNDTPQSRPNSQPSEGTKPQ